MSEYKYRVEEYDTSTIIKEADDLNDAIFHANFWAGTTESGVYSVIENDSNAEVYTAGIGVEGLIRRNYDYIVSQYTPEGFEEQRDRLYHAAGDSADSTR